MDRERAGRTKNRQGQVEKKNGSFSFACLLKGRPTVVVKLPNLWHEGHVTGLILENSLFACKCKATYINHLKNPHMRELRALGITLFLLA